MQTWALMYAHPAILEETRRRGVHPWISTGRQMRAPDPEGQVTVIAVARLRWPEKRVAASTSTRSPTVRRADAGSGRGGIVPCTVAAIGSDVLLSRTQQPASSSTGARSWPWSGQEIRWRRCRGCACYTYHSDARSNLLKLSESLVGTTRQFLCLKPAVPPNR
jgi:hypothetical protein